MSPAEWEGVGAGVMDELSGVVIGLSFLVKGWVNELRPNGGSSMKDQLTRLEQRVDDLCRIMNKRQ